MDQKSESVTDSYSSGATSVRSKSKSPTRRDATARERSRSREKKKVARDTELESTLCRTLRHYLDPKTYAASWTQHGPIKWSFWDKQYRSHQLAFWGLLSLLSTCS